MGYIDTLGMFMADKKSLATVKYYGGKFGRVYNLSATVCR